MNCSGRPSHNTPLPPAMWWRCICIVVPLNHSSQTKTPSRTRTDGAVMRPGDKNVGK